MVYHATNKSFGLAKLQEVLLVRSALMFLVVIKADSITESITCSLFCDDRPTGLL